MTSQLPIRAALAEVVAGALRKCGLEPSVPVDSSFETPPEEKFGDLATNAVFRLAKERKTAPRPLAEKVAAEIRALLPDSPAAGRVKAVAVEGAGFVNFHYSHAEISSVVPRVREEGDAFGRPAGVKRSRVLLEYVSANPTGPLTVAHGRQAALGDSLAKILRFAGHDVVTEYYNNDEGVQISNLAASLAMRVEDLLTGKADREMPENYYRGEYLVDIARDFVAEHSPRLPFDAETQKKLKSYARDRIMDGIKQDLSDFGVSFDGYYSQEELGRSGRVEATLEELKKRGKVYASEGAVWLRSTEYGDDKDRVLVKSDGNYTYLTPDIAYHHHKFERGFEEIINILGPDHHGYIARLKASQAALGHDADRIRILIAQLVTLYEDGKQVRMSTRAGEFVTLREILDEVGRDAGRFFFLMRKFDAHLDFDLSLAKSQTPENPVFYIQYAHARVESVKSLNPALVRDIDWSDVSPLAKLEHPLEIRLMRLCGRFEDAAAGAAATLEPYRLVPYLMDLAGTYHRFYAENRIVGEDAALTRARLMLSIAVQSVIRRGLGLLGVSAPAKM
jgi:arginyl-tRNA synthetase